MFEAVKFCREHQIPYRLSGPNVGTGWVGVNCPFCADTGFHGGIRGWAFTCWRCGNHRLVDFIRDALQIDSYEAADLMRQYDDLEEAKKIERRHGQASSIELPGVDSLPIGERYLLRRGFDVDYLRRKYHIRFVGPIGPFAYRIILPIHFEGKLVSYTGRDYTDQLDNKYKNLDIESSVIAPKDLLYNHDFVSGKKTVGVCEGPFDAIRLGDGFVATLGVKTSEEQVRKIAEYENVFIVFDPEVEAQKRAQDLAVRVSALGSKVSVVDTELGHDPGDMSADEVRQLRKYIGVPDEKL